MKTKTITCLFLIVAGLVFAYAQLRPTPHRWDAKIQVVDDTGQPVPGAEVRIYFSGVSLLGRPVPDKIVGLTDTNGLFVTSHVDRAVQLDFNAPKAGYYPFVICHRLGYSESNKTNWILSPQLILKKIRNPIPMYVKEIREVAVINQPVGYDLMAGDWVAPYGKGINTDILFMKAASMKSGSDYECKWTVSFPNNGDGIQHFVVPYPTLQGSKLRSTHKAPEGGYQPTVTRETSAHPGQKSKFEFDARRGYFFRLRTVLDENGNVKSALYGKIYGDFMETFSCYLNPTPNDRNVECDPARNLIRGEKVSTP